MGADWDFSEVPLAKEDSFAWMMWADSEALVREGMPSELAKTKGKKGAMVRHSKAEPLKKIAYQAAEQYSGKSANQLGFDLRDRILEESKNVGYPLSPSNAHNTIAGWIRDYRKRQNTGK